MININAKNSALNKNKIADALQNVNIKNKTECTGFSEIKTNKPLIINKKLKNECKICIN